jgi:ectoine hydroxylase-related dioxygenase (phytanoyl-CoA dioxygenase family)
MRTDLTSAQIQHYRDQGYLIYENLLSPAEIRELTDAVMTVIDAMAEGTILGKQNKDGDDYYSQVFQQRMNLWKHNATIRKYMIESGIGDLATELAGMPMRVWHDQALNKAPWANPTSWHLDNPYWSFTSRDAISIWIALDESTLQNGCMHYIPGSHKMVGAENAGIGPHMNGLFKVYPEVGRITPVCAPMKPGSCGFHNGLTAHGAGANMTPGWRRAMTCAYMPAGSAFNGNKNILTDVDFARLKIGDSLDDDVERPLVGTRIKVAV